MSKNDGLKCPITVWRLAQCELLTTKFDTKMKMNYSYNEMKRAFECGRNFQLTGENNFQELIEELNQALRQPPVMPSLPNGEKVLTALKELSDCFTDEERKTMFGNEA